jgi:hypothetical protein
MAPWFEAWVPCYISASKTFRVIVGDERGRFSMQIPCPIGAGGGSKILFIILMDILEFGAVTMRQALLIVITPEILQLTNL